MDRPRYLPDANRLSVVAAMILLAYALARFIDIPGRTLAFQLPGIYISFVLNIRTAVALLVALLTATGADWLIRQHPNLGQKPTIEHWLLPSLTAWAIGLPLFQLPLGLVWWAGFALGGTLLMLVLVAEYIAVDPDDERQPITTAGLTILSFSLFLILVTSLRFAGIRLYLLVPALMLALYLVSVRTMHLRLHGRWAFIQAGIITLVVGQLAAALHYWPISPIPYGLVLLGPAYALTVFLSNLAENQSLRQALVEPGLVLIVVLGAAIWSQ